VGPDGREGPSPSGAGAPSQYELVFIHPGHKQLLTSACIP